MIGSIVVSSLLGMAAHFGEPTATADSFTMPVKQGIILLVKGKRSVTADGEVMVFAPGLTGESLDRDLATGPVRHVRVRELPRGLALVLTPSTEIAPESIVMAEGKIKISAPAVVAAGQAAPVVEKAPVVEAAPVVEKAPVVAPGLAASAESAKAVDAPKPAFKPESSASPMRNLMVMAALVAAGAIALVMGKKRKTKIRHGASSGIELIAVRPLGPKQRLAVVEAGGDRLLIASTENGVQLLSRLTSAAPAAQADTFAEMLQEEVSAPAPVTKGNRKSADVAGLIKLRAARATWNFGEAGD